MSNLLTGLSALIASQRGLDLTGQNIANASTQGYHRQALVLDPRYFGGPVGQGVDVKTIMRIRDELVERAITSNQVRTGQVNAELDHFHQLESLFTPGTGSVGGRIADLFDRLQQLAARPDDPTQRSATLAAAQALGGAVNGLASGIDQMRNTLRGNIDDTVNQINDYAARIAAFNKQIQSASVVGVSPNELMDRRDQVLNQLAALVDVRTTSLPHGVVDVIAANITLVGGGTAERFAVQTDNAGNLLLVSQGGNVPLSLFGGTLAGQIDIYNNALPGYQRQLNTLVQTLVGGLDTIQATGLGLNGPSTSSLGVRSVSDPTAALTTSASLPVRAGTLTISISNLATGQRTVTRIAVDPATQSLQDLAASMTAATSGQVQASVTTDNRLQIQAQSGYAFDFAGRLPTYPENVAMNGTTVPSVSGKYAGVANGTFSFQVIGNGTVGVTPGLALEVRDAGNNLVSTLNIGQGYTPGSSLTAGNGLSVRLSTGTTAAGSFDIPVTVEPDDSGLLAALGVNSLFTGSTGTDLAVRSGLLASPMDLAASRDGSIGDASNLTRLLSVRDHKLLAGGTQTLEDYVSGLVGDIGQNVKDREDLQAAMSSLGQSLLTQQQGVSGVDPNEEIARMLQYQQMFQMAAKFISVVNSAMDALLNILR